MTAVLETMGLGKRYGRRRWALRDLDLVVEEGSITALVGPNGSGKSMLVMLVGTAVVVQRRRPG